VARDKGAVEEGASRSPVPVERRRREKGREGTRGARWKCIISKFGAEFTLSPGVSVPATARPAALGRGLPASAELRRRIITFYADFNTRPRVRSLSPSRVDRCRPSSCGWSLTVPHRYGISNRRKFRVIAPVALPFLVSFSPRACQSSEISWAIDRVFLDGNGGIRRDNPRENSAEESLPSHLRARARFPRPSALKCVINCRRKSAYRTRTLRRVLNSPGFTRARARCKKFQDGIAKAITSPASPFLLSAR
jgi:hypothetical protein